MDCPGLRPVASYAQRTAERQHASLTCARPAGEGLACSSADGRGLLPKQTQRMMPPKTTVTKIRMRSIAAPRGQRRKIDGAPLLRTLVAGCKNWRAVPRDDVTTCVVSNYRRYMQQEPVPNI